MQRAQHAVFFGQPQVPGSPSPLPSPSETKDGPSWISRTFTPRSISNRNTDGSSTDWGPTMTNSSAPFPVRSAAGNKREDGGKDTPVGLSRPDRYVGTFAAVPEALPIPSPESTVT